MKLVADQVGSILSAITSLHMPERERTGGSTRPVELRPDQGGGDAGNAPAGVPPWSGNPLLMRRGASPGCIVSRTEWVSLPC